MARSYIKATPIHIGGVEAAKTALSSSKMFNDQDWNSFIAQDRINEYITVLQEFDKNIDYSQFNEKYKNNLKYLSGEEKVLAMENELWGDKENTVSKTKTITNADGTQTEEKYNTTDYDYTKSLLEQKISVKKAEKLQYENQYLSEMQDRVGNALKAIPHKLIEAPINTIGALTDLANGVSNYVNALTGNLAGYTSYDLSEADRAFRDAFSKYNWDEKTVDWLQQNIFLYEEGDYANGLARYTASMADSFGRILPSIVLNGIGSTIVKSATTAGNLSSSAMTSIQNVAKGLSTTAQLSYYTAMGANNLKELFANLDIATRPTLELIANASIKTALERIVEIGLDKTFGTTVLDNMMYGAGLTSSAKGLAKNALARIGKDALQEGLEEYFQDFSGFMVDRFMTVFSDQYAACSDWTLQGAADAFMLGAVMSLGGSAINVLTTKSQTIGGVKQGKLASFEIGLQWDNLVAQVNNIDIDTMSAGEQASAIGGIFTTLRAITALNSQFGEERIQNAQRILNVLTETEVITNDVIQATVDIVSNEIITGLRNVADSDKYIGIKGLLSDISTALEYTKDPDKLKALQKEIYNELADAKISGEVTVVNKIDTDDEIDDKISGTKQEREILRELLDKSGKDKIIVTEHGIAPVEVANTIVMPENCTAFTVDTNLRTLSEQKIISAVLLDKELVSKFDGIRAIIRKDDGSGYSHKEFITLLLYDENFAHSVLYNGDRELVRLISKLDSIAKTIAKINRYDDITAKDLELIGDRLHKVLYNYYRGVPFIPQGDVEQSTILSKDEKLQLRAENWQRGIYHKVMVDNQLPSKQDLNVLDTMLNAYKGNQDIKKEMQSDLHSNDIRRIKTVVHKLVEQFRENFQGKYNGKIYAEYNGNPSNALFNMFLINNGITIRDILSGVVSPAVASTIVSANGDISPAGVFNYYNNLLRDQYGYEMVRSKGTITIRETSARSYGNKTRLKKAEQYANTEHKAEDISVKFIAKSDHLKYDIIAKDQPAYVRETATIDDVIKDGRLLSQKIAEDIQKKYKDTSPLHTYMYLRQYVLERSNGKQSIVVDNNGNYYIATIEGSDKILATNAKKKYTTLTDNINSLEQQEDIEIAATDFIKAKFLTALGNDNIPTVVVERMADRTEQGLVIDRETQGTYDAETNTITINANMDGFSYDTFIWALAHEVKHCIQYFNGLDKGNPANVVAQIAVKNRSAAKAIVADIKAHYPTAFAKVDAKNFDKMVDIADEILYVSSAGEADAYGYDRELNLYPVITKTDSKGNVTIVTPWGNEYNKNGLLHKDTVAKTKSLRFDKDRNTLVMQVNNLYDITPETTEYISSVYSNVDTVIKQSVAQAADSFTRMQDAKTRDKWVDNKANDISSDTSVETDIQLAELDALRRRWLQYEKYNAIQQQIMRLYPDMTPAELGTVTVPTVTVVGVKRSRTDYFVFSGNSEQSLYTSLKQLKTRGYDRLYIDSADIVASTLWNNVSIFEVVDNIYGYNRAVPNGRIVELEAITSDIITSKAATEFLARDDNSRTISQEKINGYTSRLKSKLDAMSGLSIDDILENGTVRQVETDLYTAYSLPYDKATFHKKYVQYIHNILALSDIQELNDYGYASGYMSASDPRRKGADSPKNRLARLLSGEEGTKIRRTMLEVANFEIAPYMTYSEFISTEMPFIRITTQTETEQSAFSGVSLGVDKLFIQSALAQKYDTPLKLYVGTIAPKDILGYTPTNEFEALIPSTVSQTAKKYTVVKQDNEHIYLLGEEFGDIDEQINNIRMRTVEDKDIDTRFSFAKKTSSERRRLVTQQQAKGTNLEHLTKPNTVVQLDPRIQDIYIQSTGQLDKYDVGFRKMIESDKPITKAALNTYMSTQWKKTVYVFATPQQQQQLDETFKLLNRTYFNNPHIKNLRTLEILLDKGPELFYAVRADMFTRIEKMRKDGLNDIADQFEQELYTQRNVKELIDFCNRYKNSNLASVMEWSERFNTYYAGQNEVPLNDINAVKNTMWFSFLNNFDGSLFEAGRIGSNIRKTAAYQQLRNVSLEATDGHRSLEETLADDRVSGLSGLESETEYKAKVIQIYLEHDALDGKIFKEGSKIAEKTRSKISEIIDNMYDEDIDSLYEQILDYAELGIPVDLKELQVIVDSDYTLSDNDTKLSLYRNTRNIVKKIQSKLTVANRAKFFADYPDIGFDENGDWTMPKFTPIRYNMSPSERHNVLTKRKLYYEKLLDVYNDIKNGKYLSKDAQQEIKAEQNSQAKAERQINKLKKEIEKLSNVKSGNILVTSQTGAALQNANAFADGQTSDVPIVLKSVFENTKFERTAKSDVKNLSEAGEVHFRRSYDDFIAMNEDVLSKMSEQDVADTLDFYEAVSVAPNTNDGTYEEFNAVRQFMLMYMYKLDSDGLLNLDDNTKQRIERMFATIKSGAGTDLSIGRLAQDIINPVKVIANSMAHQFGVEVDDILIDDLQTVIRKDYTAEAAASGKDANELRVEAIEKILSKIEKDTIAQIEDKKRQGEWHKDNTVDTIIKWQRTMMLSGVGTWIRNAVSNVMVTQSNKAGEAISAVVFNAVNKNSKFKKDIPADQYKIIGTKLDSTNESDASIISWINSDIRENGMFDLMIEASTKYDATTSSHKQMSSQAVIAELITRNALAKFTNQMEFDEGNHWWSKAIAKGGNSLIHLLYGYTDANGKVHNGVLSDKKAITKSFYNYLGRMLKEDIDSGRISQTEWAKGLGSRAVLDVVANAYVQANWDYMHRSNFFNKFENIVRKYTGDGGYFIWKQIEPFAASGWNWFVKALEYNPVGLAKAIYDYARLEKTIGKMENAKAEGAVAPTSRLATYLVQRRIGNGIIGTIGCIAGAMLAGFGVAGIDDEDGTPKLYVGDLSVDISSIVGTSGMLSGIAIAGAFIQARDNDQSWFEAVIEGLTSSLDTMFYDSVFEDVFDLMQSRETLSGVLINKTGNVLSSFVPNLLKSAMSYTTVVTPEYANGVLGKLEKQLVKTLPYVAYALPKRYDIYSGELQFKNNMPWTERWFDALMGTMTNFATPLKVKVRTTSDIEKIALSLGISKGELTGNYSDIGQLTAKQVGIVNEYYGELNKNAITALINNQVRYTVENEAGKRVPLTYSQMTAKQKKSVITRIMSNNAKYAKAYIATKSGWKYYADETMYKELKRLGITNVFLATGKKEGYIK